MEIAKYLIFLVGVAGFEPATPASRTQCSTGLSHTPTRGRLIALGFAHCKKPDCKNLSEGPEGNERGPDDPDDRRQSRRRGGRRAMPQGGWIGGVSDRD